MTLSLLSGLLIAWIIGSATWNVHWLPGVPFLKGIIMLVIGILGYNIMDRRIMGLDKPQ